MWYDDKTDVFQSSQYVPADAQVRSWPESLHLNARVWIRGQPETIWEQAVPLDKPH